MKLATQISPRPNFLSFFRLKWKDRRASWKWSKNKRKSGFQETSKFAENIKFEKTSKPRNNLLVRKYQIKKLKEHDLVIHSTLDIRIFSLSPPPPKKKSLLSKHAKSVLPEIICVFYQWTVIMYRGLSLSVLFQSW